jgi:hypothetical protein
MPFLVMWIQFNCAGFLLVCDSWIGGIFSLSIAFWSNMTFRHLWSTFGFMIIVVL